MNKKSLHIQLQAEVEPLQRMFEKFINKMLTFKKDNCNELVPLPEYSGIISLCKLYSSLATPENGVRGARAGPGRKGLWLLRTTSGKGHVRDTSWTPGLRGTETTREGYIDHGCSEGRVLACVRWKAKVRSLYWILYTVGLTIISSLYFGNWG